MEMKYTEKQTLGRKNSPEPFGNESRRKVTERD